MPSRSDPLTPVPSPPTGARGAYLFFDNRPLPRGEGAQRAGEGVVARGAQLWRHPHLHQLQNLGTKGVVVIHETWS